MSKDGKGAARRIEVLQGIYGPEMILADMDGDGGEEPYRILRELEIDGKHYAVL